MPNNPAGLIYGTIAVAALLAAESARQETYPRTAGAVAITLLLYWLAHSYSEFTGERLKRGEPFSYTAFARSAAQEVTVLLGAAIPFLVVLIFWVAGAALVTAVSAAIWTSVAIVIGTEVSIGVRADLGGRELVRQTAVGVLLGLMVIALRVLLH